MRMTEAVFAERSCDRMKVFESDSPHPDAPPKPLSPQHAHENNATHTQHDEHAPNECVQEQSCSDVNNQTQVSGRNETVRFKLVVKEAGRVSFTYIFLFTSELFSSAHSQRSNKQCFNPDMQHSAGQAIST